VWQWLLDNPHFLVILCVVALSLLSLVFDLLLGRFTKVVWRTRLGKRLLAGLSIALVTLSYVTVFALTAILMKLLGRRLLPAPRRGNESPSYWTEHKKVEPTLENLRRQG
jgi:hypothetical protein